MATPAVVQQCTSYTAAAAGTITATFTNPATTGNGILVFIGWHLSSPNITSVGDANSANLYADMQDVTGNTDNLSVYWLPAIQSGSGTITITVTFSDATPTRRWIRAFEISGGYFIPDPGTVNQNTYTSPTTNPAVSGLVVNLANELIFAAIYPEGSPTNTPQAGWTADSGASAIGQQAFYTSGVAPNQNYTAQPCTLSVTNLCLIVSIGIVAAGTWPTPTPPVLPQRTYRNGRAVPGGVYFLRQFNDTPAQLQVSPGWTFPGCVGHAIRQKWSLVETAPGVYNWQYLDLLFSLSQTYGKKVGLSIEGGVAGTPAWLTGYTAITFSTGTFPAPWDATFQAAWQTFLTALGARYGNQSLLTYVMMTGMGGTTSGDAAFATTAGDNTTFFGLFGGSQATAVATWIQATETILGFYAAAFPNVALCWNLGHTLGTSIAGGNTVAFQPFYAVHNLVNNKYGVSLKNVNLNPQQRVFAGQIPPVPYYASFTPASGYQEVKPPPANLNQLMTSMQFADASGAQLYEAYPTDFLNFAWAGVLEQFNLRYSLQRQPPNVFEIGAI